MADLKQFKLPDLGEGLTEGEILRWMVAPGDTVTLNQPIVEVETAKAAVEVPSPYAGVVKELLHDEGDTVDVGDPIITFDIDVEGGVAPPAGEQQAAQAAANPKENVAAAEEAAAETTDAHGAPPAAADPEDESGRQSVLVGYGPKKGPAKRRPRKESALPAAGSSGGAQPDRNPDRAERGSGAAVATTAEIAVLAKPPVRKMAKDLGVDLRDVTGTGPEGVITREDVETAASGAEAQPVHAGPREERVPIRSVRKLTAAAVTQSAFTAPHVTEFVTVDMTGTMDLVDRLKQMRDFREVKVSPLLVVAKALLTAVRRHPMANSTWDDDAQEIVIHHFVNLGIAAATPRGLLVPNIKDADRLSLVELAQALDELARTAKEGKTAPADMQRGTITITNVGVFGVDNGTPILTPGEAAILCLGAVRDMPWVHEGELAVRKVTQLALSFDHRIIDGQLGSEFLADVGAMLADPALFLAWS